MNKDLQGGYLDILFAHRNKAYGAYELRKNYDRRMIVSGLLMCSFVALFVGWNALKNDSVANTNSSAVIPRTDTIMIRTVIPEKKIPPPEQVHPAQTGRTAKTQQFAVTKVVKDDQVDKPALKRLADDALAGPVDNPGLSGGKAIALDNSLQDGTGDPTEHLSKKGKTHTDDLPSDGEPLNFASEKPQFPGGEAAMKKYLSDNLNYPLQARTDGTSGTVHVSFVVNTDGSVVDVRVIRGVGSGCSEEAARVVKAMPKWVAGRHKGQLVKVKMTIPVKFVLGN